VDERGEAHLIALAWATQTERTERRLTLWGAAATLGLVVKKVNHRRQGVALRPIVPSHM